MTSCFTGPKTGKKTEKCWKSFRCPAGFSRYGDGSMCKKGKRRCDLGFCAGRPNGGMTSCSTGPAEGEKKGKCWKSLRCPAGYARHGDGSSCKKGRSRCDLGYCEKKPNKDMPGCGKGGKANTDGKDDKEGEDEDEDEGKKDDQDGKGGKDEDGEDEEKRFHKLNGHCTHASVGDAARYGVCKADKNCNEKEKVESLQQCKDKCATTDDCSAIAWGQPSWRGTNVAKYGNVTGNQCVVYTKGCKDSGKGTATWDLQFYKRESEDEKKCSKHSAKSFQKMHGHCRHASVGGHTRYGVCKADKNCNEKEKVKSLQQCEDKCHTTNDCAAIAWGVPSWRGNVAKYGNVTGHQCVVYTKGCKSSGKGTKTWGFQYYTLKKCIDKAEIAKLKPKVDKPKVDKPKVVEITKESDGKDGDKKDDEKKDGETTEASTKASTKAPAASTTAKAAPTNAPTTTAAPTKKPDATTVPPTKDEDEDQK